MRKKTGRWTRRWTIWDLLWDERCIRETLDLLMSTDVRKLATALEDVDAGSEVSKWELLERQE